MSETKKKDKNFAVSINEYIRENYADKRISIEFFRELTGYGISRINSVYKSKYQETPIETLQKRRIKMAREFIKNGVPLGMAAYDAGYGSIRTFYRVFKQNMGMTPDQYKQKIIKNQESISDLIKMHPLKPIDYAKKACSSIMYHFDATELLPYGFKENISRYSYHQGMFLLGMYKLYKLCGEERFLNYPIGWIDSVIDEDCDIKHFHWFNECVMMGILDTYQPITLLISLYNETSNGTYIKTIENVMERFWVHPATNDGVLWHSRVKPHQLQLNRVYMLCPTLCMYAKILNEPRLYDIAVIQPIVMYEHMLDEETGLLWRAWDTSKAAEWSDPATGILYEKWGRAMGYFVMGVADMLEYLPKDHPKRSEVEEIQRKCLCALEKHQDESGRWYQVPDKGEEEENWFENSSSCMYVYSMAKAINMGIFGKEHKETVLRGYGGIIDTIEYNELGEMILNDISGTPDLGDFSMYNLKLQENDLHGIGAFVLMCTEVEKLLNDI